MRTIYRVDGKRISTESLIERDGTKYTFHTWGKDLAGFGVVEVLVEDYPDPTWNTWTENEDGTLNITPLSIAKCKEIKKQSVAAERYTREVAGIVLPSGAKIATDRDSRSLLNSAFISLFHGLIPSTPWKGENGWVPLTLAEITPVAKAVAEYVSGLFAWEKEQSDLIDALTTREAVINFVVETLPQRGSV